jgi:hypothetical protein
MARSGNRSRLVPSLMHPAAFGTSMGSTKDDVYPPDPETMKIFEAIGGAIGVESLREDQAAGFGSALMAVAAGVHEASVRWLKTAWSPLRHGPTYPV